MWGFCSSCHVIVMFPPFPLFGLGVPGFGGEGQGMLSYVESSGLGVGQDCLIRRSQVC